MGDQSQTEQYSYTGSRRADGQEWCFIPECHHVRACWDDHCSCHRVSTQDRNLRTSVKERFPTLLKGVQQDKNSRLWSLHPYPYLFESVVFDDGSPVLRALEQGLGFSLNHVHLPAEEV